MTNKIATGSGASMHWLDREKKRVKIDFSGYDGDLCFRNDASILFFASNSYRSAFLSLGRDLEERFESYIDKDIEHLILPYLFNFRHFVELELKALYVAVTNKSPDLTHDLKFLLTKVEESIIGIDYNTIDKSYRNPTEDQFNKIKDEAIGLFTDLKAKISIYIDKEPAQEYYRYIFEDEKKGRERYIILKNTVVELDFLETDSLFKSIRSLFDKLRLKLRDIIYVYCSI